ncbi:hypothetical protein QWZ16_19685 [Vibrio ostreicida]|uniref:Uncharacterized protein n=1 Tax=Vibrio ostreicida TaxID=526588 RepID=A0ABT8BXE9_9VIBR|nr:hypothetical protein [Vibrio ostreicida]MDN3611067.1 hypothetical protein [Vibrio ostreicida]MDN3611820.1 hypothetical protein [Vibrio ostreicida]
MTCSPAIPFTNERFKGHCVAVVLLADWLNDAMLYTKSQLYI